MFYNEESLSINQDRPSFVIWTISSVCIARRKVYEEGKNVQIYTFVGIKYILRADSGLVAEGRLFLDVFQKDGH